MVGGLSSRTFVGRQRELDQLAQALAKAREGHPLVVVVAGEAGVGKTRFVNEVAARARAQGVRAVEGGCFQLGSEAHPFGPFAEILRRLVHEVSAEEFAHLMGSGQSTLAWLIPDVSAQMPRVESAALTADAPRPSLFEQLFAFLGQLAAAAPLLVVIEDIHWADRSTLAFLRFLIRNLHDVPIVVVATYRSDELTQYHPLPAFLVEAERAGHIERIDLGRFERDEVEVQIEDILGRPAAPTLIAEVYARSQGNPFYAEELIAGGPDAARLPGTLQEVLLARLGGLSGATQGLLRVASAAGRTTHIAVLTAAMHMSEEALEACLREALDRHVLVRGPGARDDQYVFRHALVREAVYDDLLPGERARFHAAFAAALSRPDAADADAYTAAELAYHWHAAGDLPRAFDASINAGTAAEAISAFAEAQASFERALELWDHVPNAPARAPLDRVDLLVRAANAAEGPTPSRSLEHIRTALELVDAAAEPATVGILRARFGRYTWMLLDDANALFACREAVGLVPADPPTVARAFVLARLGRQLTVGDHHEESVGVCNEAIRVARAVGAQDLEGHAFISLGADLAALGDIDGGIATISRGREIGAEIADVDGVARGGYWLTTVLREAGRYEEAVGAGFEADSYAVQHGLAARLSGVDLGLAADALMALGRWDEAAAALRRAQRYEPTAIVELDVEERLALLEALRGAFESAQRRIRRLRRNADRVVDPERLAPLMLASAVLAAWQGEPRIARAAIRETLARIAGAVDVWVGHVGPLWAVGIRAEADIAAQARIEGSDAELGEAIAIGAELLRRAQRFRADIALGRPVYLAQADAWLATCEAEVARVDGESRPELWRPVATAWKDLRMPYHAAYALMREGEALLTQRRNRSQAIAALDSAYTLADRLGAVPLRRYIQQLAERIGARPTLSGEVGAVDETVAGPTPTASFGLQIGRPPARQVLTPRELDVLNLLCLGHSDQEIAAELFISKKTASVHISNIKVKLGAANRVEIVTDAIAFGLVATPAPG